MLKHLRIKHLNKTFKLILIGLLCFSSNLRLNGQSIFRSQASSSTFISGTNIAVNKPTGTSIGDLMIANIATNGNNTIATSPGWTILKSGALGNTTTYATILYKIVNSNDISTLSYTFSLGTAASNGSVGILTFSAVDTTRPIDTVSLTLNSGNSRFVTANGITTNSPKTALLMLGQTAGTATSANFWNNSFWRATSPSTLTEIQDQTGTNTSVGAAWAPKNIIGATGNGTDSISLSSRWGSLLIAIRSCIPQIRTQPILNTSICINAIPTPLSVNAVGMGTINYQWFSNSVASYSGGTAIVNATSSNYSPSTATTGLFYYYVVASGSCGTDTSTISTFNVNQNNTISLTSAVGTNAQTKCINTAITNITYSSTGATGATLSGLPTGVTSSFAGNIVTISGTPTASGTFNYTVTLTGGCGTVTAIGSITVSALNTITFSSAAGTNAQTRCINTAITNITYSSTGATGATVSNLPAGVTSSFAGNVITISGTPTASGTFNYTVTPTGGCGNATASGSIVVTANNTITLSSAAGTNAQTKCINTAITNITYSSTGATGATLSGLPTGVTSSFASNVVRISGTPTASGIFNYTVTLSGGCGTITATGSITVSALNTIALSSAAGTNAQTKCVNQAITNITYTTTGATGATISGLPTGVTGTWVANTLTISGTPTATGTYNYTISLTGGCGNITATGTIIVSSNNSITTQPPASINLCSGGTLSIPVTVSGTNTFQWKKNGINITNANTNPYTKSNVSIADTGTYTVEITNGCGTITSQNCVVRIISGVSVSIIADYCASPNRIKLTAVITPNNTGSTTAYTYLWSNGGVRDTTYASIAGNYSVTVTPTAATTSSTGCSGSAVATLNVSQELVSNGNFSLGNVGFTCPPLFGVSYRYYVDSPNYQRELSASGRYGVGANANNYNAAYYGKDHTTGTGNFMVVRGYSFIKPMVWSNTVNVIPNTTYYFSGWAMGIDSTAATNTPILRFSVNGAIVGNPLTLPPHRLSPTAPNNWLRFYATWNSGSATSAVFSIYDSTATFRGNAFGLDDISIGPLSTFISLTSSAATDTQTVCINTPILPVTMVIGSGGLPVVTGLPAGVSYTYNGYQLTISGSPTIAGTFNYSVATSGCAIKTFYGQIISQSQNLILTSPQGTDNQAICIGNPITRISYNIIGNSTAPNVSGLPSGVTYSFISGALSISGTPAQAGNYTYTITTTGGNCTGGASVTGNINVVALPIINISIDSCLMAGRLVLKAVPQPSGAHTFLWNNGATTDTISVNTSGTYSVSVINATGCRSSRTQTVNIGLVQTSSPTTSNQNACLNTAITPIIYSAGGNLISFNASGLPTGVTANFSAGNITISGSPTQLGTYNYTLNFTGSLCGNDLPILYTRTGTIIVNTNPTVSIAADFCAVNNRIRLTATPTPTGTYTYLWSSGSVSDTALVNTAGNFTVTATNTVGCRATASYLVNTEISVNGNFSSGNTGFVSVATGNLPAYTFVSDSVNFQGELLRTGLYGVDTNANNYNVNYYGHDHTTRTGKFMIIHSYPTSPGSPQTSQEPILWQQTLTVQPNTTYYFSGWAMGLDSSGDYASLKFLVNGNQIGNNLSLIAHGRSSSAPDNWLRFYATWNSNNNTTAIFSIQNEPSATNFFAGNAIGLDDISIGKITPYITLTSNPITDTQYVCINTPIQPTTFTYGSGAVPTVTGLPVGVTMTITNTTLTISGTPTVAGNYNYTINTAGCSVARFFGQIKVQSTNLLLTSASTTTNQAICFNSPITNIVYSAVTSVTGVSVTGLPAGVDYNFNAGILTISGTPTVSGVFNYTITNSGGGCSATNTYTGTITIKVRSTVNITIDYCTLPGKALLKAIPSPTGTHTFLWSTGRNTDTCSVTTSGTYSVTVTNSVSCQTVASIVVTVGMALTSATGTNNQSVCLGDTMRRISYVAAANISNVNISGLPVGVNYIFAANTVNISGTPTTAGTYNYTITPTVSCGSALPSTGVIKVIAKPTVSVKTSYCATPGRIKLTATVTPTGTYTYLWSNGTTRDTTSVNSAGLYSVTVTNTGTGCSSTASVRAGFELAVNGDFSAGNTGFNTPLFFNQQYQYVPDAPGIQTELQSPGFYSIDTNANNFNASYQGHDHTTRNGKFMIVHGFPLIQVPAWEKTVNVVPNTLYYFSAWAQGLDSLNNNPILKFTVNGNQLGTNLALVNHGQSPTAPDNWTRFYGTWNSGTATAASFAITDVQTISLGNSFGLDDISIGAFGPFISLVSPASTDTQIVCLNSPIVPVNLAIGLDSLPPVVTGLPPGVTHNFDGYNLTISGAPTTLGTFNYIVSISGCVPKTFRGQIVSQGQTLVLTSAPGSNVQNVCTGNAITNIVYNAGVNISSSAVSVSGLPAGITYAVASGIVTISGTPTQIGTFNYTLSVTGGICSSTTTTTTATGTITATALPTLTIISDYCTLPGRVKLKAVPNPAGNYTYYWNNGALTDTTIVDLVGNYTVTATNNNGCRVSTTISVSSELVTNWNFNQGNTGFVTSPTGTQRYIYVSDSINYQRELYPSGRYGIGINANNYSDLCWGHDHTTGNGNFMIVHGYAFATPILWQDTVQVTPNTDYYFSAWGMSLNSIGFNGRLRFSINSTQVGNTLTLPNRGNSDTAADNWTRFYTIWNSGTSTSAILSITNTQISPLGNSFGIDDISFASMAPFINLVSSPSTDTQTVCINNNIIPVSLTVGSGGSVVVSGLPNGVTYTYDGFNLLITGAPTAFGAYNYTISLSSTCASRTFYGQIICRGQAMSLTSPLSTANQTICLRTPIVNIVLQATGNITNVNVTGLPAGVTGVFNQGVFTISGTPTQTGVFNYTVSTVGPFCNASTYNGRITINASPVAIINANPSTTISCSNPSILLTASGGTQYTWGSGLGATSTITVSNSGTYAVLVGNSIGCFDSASIIISGSIPANVSSWLGINTNWNDPVNWCGGIPNAPRNVVLNAGLTNYPTISSIANCATITLNPGTTLKIDSNATLFVYGNFINNGSVTNNGIISLTGTTTQTFPGQGIIVRMNTLQINNAAGVSLDNSINVNLELKPTNGILALGNFDITLKSDANATASVSAIGSNAGFTYGNGRFVVERYIPTGSGIGQHGKSWQFITAPIRGTQTVKQSWQENATLPNQNPIPGYGTQITSDLQDALALGFDVRSTSSSMKTYDTATNVFTGIPSTNNYPIQNRKGFMVFIRGNRNVTTISQLPEPTTLRSRGTIHALGTDAPAGILIAAGGYQSIGNPYPSAIDFTNTTGVVFDRGNSIDNAYYVWDPRLTGTYGNGGYQTISAVNNWIPVPGGTSNYPTSVVAPKIQSGQAFFMHATGSGGLVSFNENAKTSGSVLVNRENNSPSIDSTEKQLFESGLYVLLNGEYKLADGNFLVTSSAYSNDYNADDAPKLSNSAENFSLTRDGKSFAIEARQPIQLTDTIFYSTKGLRTGNYRFNFKPYQMESNALVPYIIDQHLQTRTMLSFADTTHYDFSVLSNTTSASSNRFIIVMEPSIVLPLQFTEIKALRKNEQKVLVDWKTENESALNHFEVQRGNDGRVFESVSNLVQPFNNVTTNTYHFEDNTANNSNLYYRIKAVDLDGSSTYSNIVKVGFNSVKPEILIYPNPVVNRKVCLTFKGHAVGSYQMDIYSTSGQLIKSELIALTSEGQVLTMKLPYNLSAGTYILKCNLAGETIDTIEFQVN